MTHNDKQDVIAICNILADKMSDSGKVAVQQIIGAVEDMVENEPCEDTISRAALLEELGEEPFNWNDSPEEFQEVRDYQWFRSLVENAPPVTTRKIRGIKMEEVIKVDDCVGNIGDYDIPIHNAIIVPENVTNGDVIKNMFPNIIYEEGYVFVESDTHQKVIMTVQEDWWNAPYKAESED